ncbi:MAG TPA: glycosyltransferase family A protein [Vicinamibacterales bacterium]|nr:glycosyltransferase family A protein [Vicinamibacterales bacterium]
MSMLGPAPLVSVIIPCYNQGCFLGEAIASAWRSSPGDTEIIVIDDGSTDDTAAVCRSFAGVRWFGQRNEGPARARNRGLRESRGRFVVFLDADDMLAPGALDVGAAELAAHPAAAFVFGRCRALAPDGTVLPMPEQARVERDHYRELLKRNYVWMPAMAMFRREAVERTGGLDPTADGAAAYGLCLQIARSSPVHDHGQVVAYHRKRDGSVRGGASRMLHGSLTVLRRERPFVQHDPALLEAYYEGWRVRRDFYGAHLSDEIRTHVRQHEWSRAALKAATLCWLHPRALAHHAVRTTPFALRRGTGHAGGAAR